MFSKPQVWALGVIILIFLGIGAKIIARDFNEYSLGFALLVVVVLIAVFITFSILFI